MRIIVNGEPRELPDGASVAQAVAAVTAAASGVAAALNDEVVRRSAWEATTLREADRLEVLTAVQGG
ncbi:MULTISPECIES: sulfur carrier protein ThiS [Actinomadura]|uniref:Thiamine biosynthesis protein ThiS n=2 Tax=Actinomadura TaxID=1988 RepID=A0A7D3W1V5_ACTVE|nr:MULTISPECIES: sulfur carrier protein ThiS [Actinomadura]MBO2461857.1 sulfur carrier protein ThiS [Actinomadura violacea]QKG26514.1 thiamine biosynthesis protein ThiS [Actinomadura verrucosospora]